MTCRLACQPCETAPRGAPKRPHGRVAAGTRDVHDPRNTLVDEFVRAIALLRRKTGDRAAALRDYQRAHAIYSDLRARGYGGAYAAFELGSTELELGDLESEDGHPEEACRWYRQSAAVFDELTVRGALRSDTHEEAEKARRAATGCGR